MTHYQYLHKTKTLWASYSLQPHGSQLTKQNIFNKSATRPINSINCDVAELIIRIDIALYPTKKLQILTTKILA